VRKLFVVFIGIVGLTLSLLARAQAPPQEQASEPFFFPPLAWEFTPEVPPEIANLPVPRLHDGKPDLLDDPGAFSRPVNLKFTARVLPPGQELMEFICTENNQYGPAGGIPNIYREKGYGIEVPVPKR
jgi:hypothetical protein